MMTRSSGACPADLPFVTSHELGIGGRIKVAPEDFVVEEIPAYSPCGAGEHLYLEIEKRGITTFDAIARVARAFGVPRHVIGYAGMKDARAVTRQWLSVQLPKGAPAVELESESLRVLHAARHKNKLKLGHLRGNRFRIRLRDVIEGALPRAQRVVSILTERGMPNGFGAQRFGTRGDTHRLGRALLRGDAPGFFRVLFEGVPDGAGAEPLARLLGGDVAGALDALPAGAMERRIVAMVARRGGGLDDALRALERPLRRLYFSAVQAECFNEVLTRRLAHYDSVIDGDLAWLHKNGACFEVTDLAVERERAKRLEISASGPLFGSRCSRPIGEAQAIEDAVLSDLDLSAEAFAERGEMEGARRPLRVPVVAEIVTADDVARTLDLVIELPPGAYATTFLRELTKDASVGKADDAPESAGSTQD